MRCERPSTRTTTEATTNDPLLFAPFDALPLFPPWWTGTVVLGLSFANWHLCFVNWYFRWVQCGAREKEAERGRQSSFSRKLNSSGKTIQLICSGSSLLQVYTIDWFGLSLKSANVINLRQLIEAILKWNCNLQLVCSLQQCGNNGLSHFMPLESTWLIASSMDSNSFTRSAQRMSPSHLITLKCNSSRLLLQSPHRYSSISL